ncbi:MAG: hypothetical protein M1840_002789 [Geoglossum simile]|nr:MAG: hypothetical protein M1840_002789 [Geoglossum simile]
MVDEVPRLVKEYWAKYLTSAARRWSTDHFIEMNLIEMAAVTIDGSIDYDLADRLARKVKAEDILKAFEAPDADEEEPSMRLYWEYLECVEWDDNLYKGLKMEKRSRAII